MKNNLNILLALLCLAGPVAAQAADGPEYGPVRVGETLFRIAGQYRQPGVTMAQLMMSIFEANPDAFDQGNINRLKVGAILRIPTAAELSSLTPRQAYRAASEQIQVYETEVRAVRVERGELPPLADRPRDPDLDTGIVISPEDSQLEEMKQQLASEQQQLLLPVPGGVLPDPKPSAPLPQRAVAGPPFRWSYDLSVVSDDNIRLSRDSADIREDTIYGVTVKAQKGISMGDTFALFNFGGQATYNAFSTFDTLNNLEYEVNARYRFALASGFTAPIFSISAAIGGVDYDSEMRDSTLYKLGLSMNKWVTNTINLTTGISFNERESVSAVFDMSETRLFVNFDTELSKVDLVYTTLTLILGDTASSATPSVDVINASTAIEPDDAFGGLATNQFAYRIESLTRVFTLGYNRILTSSLSLDLSARLISSEAVDDSEVYYERSILRASLLGRF